MKIAKLALGAVAGALLIVGGAMAVETDIAVNKATSTFTKSNFDYIVVAPSAEQVATFKANTAAVSAVFTTYNYELNLKAKSQAKLFLLMNEDMADYDITFFNPRRIEEGEFQEDGIMLDRVAANKIGAKVGDDVNFSLGGQPFTLKVCSIYSEVNYQTMQSGVAMAKFTATMAAAFATPSSAHDQAFIAAKNKAACATMLNGYVPMGGMATYAEYKEMVLAGTPAATEEQIQEAYQAYVADYPKTVNKKNVVQDKATYMAGAEDTVSTRKANAFRLSVLFAIFVPLVLAGGLVGFDFLGKAKDEAEKTNGRARDSFLKNKLLFNGIASSGATVIALVGVLIYSLVRSSMSVGTLLLYSLPALAAFLIALPFVFLYTNKLYGKKEEALLVSEPPASAPVQEPVEQPDQQPVQPEEPKGE